MQVSPDKYPLGEGVDLSVARQRFYVSALTPANAFPSGFHLTFHHALLLLLLQAPSLLSPETQFLVSTGCDNSFQNSGGSSVVPHRAPGFKALGSRPGCISPAAAFMTPHSGEPNTRGPLSSPPEMMGSSPQSFH